MLHAIILFSTSVFLLFFTTVSFGEGRRDTEALVRQLAEPVVGKDKPVFGCVIGVIEGGQVRRFGFGRIDEQSNSVPDEKTVYEIASVTKLFTGLLLADMVVRGEVKLDDPLADLLPHGITLPRKSDRPVTLLDMAEHRSGLPRLAPDFWETANRTPGNPYVLFTREKVYESLALWEPEFDPQERYEYSNYAYALLGNALAANKGKTFEELLDERVLGPLGMSETTTVLDEPLAKRLAPPHDAEGKRCQNWDLSTGFAPGGGLRSTLDDMLKFATAALGDFEPLDEAFTLAQLPRADGAGEGRKIGLGWNYHVEKKFHWHNGQTGGYFSMFVLDRSNRIAVVILSNSFNDTPDSLGVKILEAVRR